MSAAGPAPFPVATPLLVGREREQARLRDALAAALAGRGSLVLLGGEAGIGKTALAEWLAREAAEQGALVLVGRCYDLSETPPYGPWVEACEQLPDEQERSSLPVPLGRGEVAPSQVALFARVRDVLGALTTRQPLVVLLDDLHWADPASLDLLRALARQAPGLPLLLVVLYRADELTRRHPLYQLLPVLVREAQATQLDLRALLDAAVHHLVRARYALHEADERRLAAYLGERAAGHPLFVGELLRTLEEEGTLRREEAGWRLGDLGGLRVPRRLRQVIERRLDRLDDEDQRRLTVAAVIGQEVTVAVWATVAEADEGGLLDLLERAVAARVLEASEDSVHFAHALIREALYEGLVPPRRRHWHRRVGEALLARPTPASGSPDPDAVAYHLRRAGDPRAAEWLVHAGDRAARTYAWQTAVTRYEAALALLPEAGPHGAERGWVLARLATQLTGPDPQRSLGLASDAARLAAAAGDHTLGAYAAFQRALACCTVQEYQEGLAELRHALAALEALPAPALARIAAARGTGLDPSGRLVMWLASLGYFAEARALADSVLARPAAGAGAGAAAFVAGYYGLGMVQALTGRPDEARCSYARACAGYRAVEDWRGLHAIAGQELSWVVLPYEADRPDRRRAVRATLDEAWGRTRDKVGDWHVALPFLLLFEGCWDAARCQALAARRTGVGAASTALTARVLGPLALAQGDTALAWQLVHESLPAGPATAPGTTIYPAALVLQRVAAGLAVEAGDLAAARAWLAAHDRWLAWAGATLGRAEGALGWATVQRAAGDLASAHQHGERALAHAGEPRQPLALLAAHRLLGELDTAMGRHADAAAHLDQALALAEACAAPYERALTLLALAELRAATGDRDVALALVEDVRTIGGPLGAAPLLARADALAATLALLKPGRARYPASLTAREVEVLRLVAAGRSNREIAGALFITPRTVERHLENLYRKVGVHSKAEATAYAFRHGLT